MPGTGVAIEEKGEAYLPPSPCDLPEEGRGSGERRREFHCGAGARVRPHSASAQSGHFVGTPTCEDTGTQLWCDGKVAGLGGTTFRIEVQATNAGADVTCTNPGGNVAPGQSFSFNATGTTGTRTTPRNGSFNFRNLSAIIFLDSVQQGDDAPSNRCNIFFPSGTSCPLDTKHNF